MPPTTNQAVFVSRLVRSDRSTQSSSRDLRGVKERRWVLWRLIVVVGSVLGFSSCILSVGKRLGCVSRQVQISEVHSVNGGFDIELRAYIK